MVMVQGIHVSDSENRESIERQGLLCHRPTEDGNWQGTDLSSQPRGVYMTLPEFAGVWRPRRVDKPDMWKVAFVGPLMDDPEVHHAVVSLEPIPPEWVKCDE